MGKNFETTLKLLSNNKSASQLTVSEIASEAGVYVALINYHDQSKDNLLQLVVKG